MFELVASESIRAHEELKGGFKSKNKAVSSALPAFITDWPNVQGMDWLDRSAIGYLVCPVVIFLASWCNIWVSVIALSCMGFYLIPLVWSRSSRPGSVSISVVLLSFATAVFWVYLSGIGHFRFANLDWLIRDAVLHDLVVSSWPVGYGQLQGQETLLRTTVAYFLPAAALGKLLGLRAAQTVLMVWTALGAGLFFLQVITLLPRRKSAPIAALLVVMLFSGMDILGSLLNGGENFLNSWRIDGHLEWWAEKYQYSSMTTQLFWVPNHAVGAWLFVGLLFRSDKFTRGLLPIALVSLMLWSPLAAAGVLPFVFWGYATCIRSDRSPSVLHPYMWVGALLVAIPIVGYLTFDLGGIDNGILSMEPVSLVRILLFFFLEVGIVGWIVCALHPSVPSIIALSILLVLPIGSFGPVNDLVMRGSIPSLAVLVIAVCMALMAPAEIARKKILRFILIVFLCVGAVTPIQEIARSFVQPRWNPRSDTTLVGASCGRYWHHYIAKLDESPLRHLMRAPNALPLGAQSSEFCAERF